MCTSSVEIKELRYDAIPSDLLLPFHHDQQITEKWINDHGQWTLLPIHDVRTWNTEKRIWIADYLKEQIRQGGTVLGAFHGSRLVGFASIDGILMGSSASYTNLTMLFVDDDCKRMGIGTRLFHAITEFAKKQNAAKLFISAIPAKETIAFYRKMGCVDATEIIDAFVDTEEDRYLEFPLL